MKKNLILTLLIAFELVIGVSPTKAQEIKSGWMMGASGDMIWSNNSDPLFFQPRIQISRMVGMGDNTYSFPGLSWRSLQGDLGPDVGFYYVVKRVGNWRILGGGGGGLPFVDTKNKSPLQLKGNVNISALGIWSKSESFGATVGLRFDYYDGSASSIPEAESSAIVTVSVAVIGNIF